jgi:hypothetical protein
MHGARSLIISSSVLLSKVVDRIHHISSPKGNVRYSSKVVVKFNLLKPPGDKLFDVHVMRWT